MSRVWVPEELSQRAGTRLTRKKQLTRRLRGELADVLTEADRLRGIIDALSEDDLKTGYVEAFILVRTDVAFTDDDTGEMYPTSHGVSPLVPGDRLDTDRGWHGAYKADPGPCRLTKRVPLRVQIRIADITEVGGSRIQSKAIYVPKSSVEEFRRTWGGV